MAAKDTAKEVVKESKSPVKPPHQIKWNNVVSTGSTLLDLSISGGRVEGGGIPGGIMVEIYGPSGQGKSALLAEICASAMSKGGEARFCDPEGRLDKEYADIYGMNIPDDQYFRPDTVREWFKVAFPEFKNENVINVSAADSLAAFSTEMEMEDQDKMGMKRAKDFSEGLRKHARIIAHDHRLLVCSNQVRDGDGQEVTPGGKGVGFYSSLRMRIGPAFSGSKLEREITLKSGRTVKKQVGIRSDVRVTKSTIDDPFRVATVSILFGYGIDDIRDQLQWYKDMTKETKYNAIEGTYQAINAAVASIEKHKLEADLRARTVKLWMEIEAQFKMDRPRKKR